MLIQILKTGFFHADPHPGNLAVDKDGSLIYYDFGMMGEIKSFTQERLLELFYAVYEKDAKKVCSFSKYWLIFTFCGTMFITKALKSNCSVQTISRFIKIMDFDFFFVQK